MVGNAFIFNSFFVDMNIDNLLNGLDAKDKDLFRREFAKEAKKYGQYENNLNLEWQLTFLRRRLL